MPTLDVQVLSAAIRRRSVWEVIRHLFTPLSSRDHPPKKQNAEGKNT
jgi:hypothetical protein